MLGALARSALASDAPEIVAGAALGVSPAAVASPAVGD
jgi:hypothetical protein